jgi:hypothetical protein
MTLYSIWILIDAKWCESLADSSGVKWTMEGPGQTKMLEKTAADLKMKNLY